MIIFDEVDYAEAIIRNGCSKRNVLLDFNILAKYYMYYIGLSEQGTKEKMLDVLKNSDIYIPISYFKRLNIFTCCFIKIFYPRRAEIIKSIIKIDNDFTHRFYTPSLSNIVRIHQGFQKNSPKQHQT